jgi:hypothetical protein
VAGPVDGGLDVDAEQAGPYRGGTPELLFTMGQPNLPLACIVTVMTGYLGTYSAHFERTPYCGCWSISSTTRFFGGSDAAARLAVPLVALEARRRR